MDVKGFVKNNLLKLIFVAACTVSALIAVILAAVVTKNDGKIDATIIVVTAIAICISVVTLFFDYKDLGKTVAAGMYLCGCMLFVSSQFGNIGYAVAGIHDIGNGIQPGFIAGTVFYVAATVLQSIVIFKKSKNKEN